MNCICDLFQDPTTWLIIIALILLFGLCNGSCNNSNSSNGCGCL